MEWLSVYMLSLYLTFSSLLMSISCYSYDSVGGGGILLHTSRLHRYTVRCSVCTTTQYQSWVPYHRYHTIGTIPMLKSSLNTKHHHILTLKIEQTHMVDYCRAMLQVIIDVLPLLYAHTPEKGFVVLPPPPPNKKMKLESKNKSTLRQLGVIPTFLHIAI